MNNTLDLSTLFPYIAWTVVVLFAIFTYTLTSNLYAELDGLGKESDSLEAQVFAD